MANFGYGPGSFLQGLSSGLLAADERKRRREMLDLQKKKLDLEDKEHQFKLDDLKRKLTQGQKIDSLTDEYVGASSQQSAFEGYEPNPEETSLMNPAEAPKRAPGDILKEILIRSGKGDRLLDKPSSADQRNYVVGPGASLRDASGQELFTNPAIQREGVSDRSNLWFQYKSENPGKSAQELLAGWEPYLRALGAAPAAGRVAGEVGEKLGTGAPSVAAPSPSGAPTPKPSESPYLQLQRKQGEIRRQEGAIPESADAAITSMRSIIQRLEQIDPEKKGSLYKDDYVGPIRNIQSGARETFGETPMIGDLIGGRIDEQESQFRQAVNSVFNEISNLRGGKVLPENELRRIEREAALLSQSPSTFKARYKGFRQYVEGLLANRINVVGSSRGSLSGQGAAPTERKLRFNLETGKLE